jgi:hypothetical protein
LMIISRMYSQLLIISEIGRSFSSITETSIDNIAVVMVVL